MNGIAWVVEVKWIGESEWVPYKAAKTRKHAREKARQTFNKTRVRKYLRQPETRP